ncbi:exonuclease SbcCD subunit D C-terminal domain-containing protein [Methylomagnum ishizawai]|uniref:exonuclease SbcCD subunit D C-terminal domain-containing protein n=1 Tax=Methylomagnum ishizawai TaxID=1760988 RepID=UPI001C32B8D8|nr:exonuclease SbcCD subunit D C-terminal domain-containing protein [Methylomagnum ishizawai]BBL75264.1 nuclease SbcCD subunit D [Methylomagnum ishizawai]
MRLLHTSDWHLGQTFHDYDREEEHKLFLDWLLDRLEAERADALLVAGDIFDNANPSAKSQEQLYRFVSAAKRLCPRLDIVLIAGNHDSPARLEAPSPLLDAFGVRVVGPARDPAGGFDPERLVVPLTRADGTVGAWCLAVPFLRPADLAASEDNDVLELAEDDYVRGVKRLYRRVLDAALVRRQAGQALIALGHCHIAGGAVSEDSERRIVVGGADSLPRGIFAAELAYVALGHLHRAQTIGGEGRLRYSGSPLPLSFSEIDYPHQILRVDLDGERVAAVEAIPVPRFVPLLRVPEQHAPVTEVLDILAGLDLPEVPLRPYLEVRVRLDLPEPGLAARIEAALDGKHVRLARIDRRHGPAAGGEDPAQPLEELGDFRPGTVFQNLYARHYHGETPPELRQAFDTLLSLCQLEEGA